MGNCSQFYEVLNIPKNSSPQEVRRAYKNLVKKWHPDKHPPASKPEAEAMFKAITQAYEALTDRDCDEVGCDGRSAGWQQQRRDEAPPAKELKDKRPVVVSSPCSAGSAKRKPPPVERKLECTLEELYRGCKKEIRFTRDVVTKNGLIVKREELQTIKVKPGWKKGTKITFEGLGNEADVVFVISEKEHPIFRRSGDDLVLKLRVPLADALTGWAFSVRLLSGEKMSCSLQDEIIHPGFEKLVKGQGMPVRNEKDVRGNLRVKFHIVFPKQLRNEQRLEIMELFKGSTWS